jgi:hypothetical protein
VGFHQGTDPRDDRREVRDLLELCDDQRKRAHRHGECRGGLGDHTELDVSSCEGRSDDEGRDDLDQQL